MGAVQKVTQFTAFADEINLVGRSLKDHVLPPATIRHQTKQGYQLFGVVGSRPKFQTGNPDPIKYRLEEKLKQIVDNGRFWSETENRDSRLQLELSSAIRCVRDLVYDEAGKVRTISGKQLDLGGTETGLDLLMIGPDEIGVAAHVGRGNIFKGWQGKLDSRVFDYQFEGASVINGATSGEEYLKVTDSFLTPSATLLCPVFSLNHILIVHQ